MIGVAVISVGCLTAWRPYGWLLPDQPYRCRPRSSCAASSSVLSSPSPDLIGGLTGRSSNHRPGDTGLHRNRMFPISTFNAEAWQARLRVKPGNDTGRINLIVKCSSVAESSATPATIIGPDRNEAKDQTGRRPMDTRVSIAPQIPFQDDAARGIFRYSPKVYC